MTPRFLIETALPLRELSEEARREKAIRHGHISTLHVWWARRPLVVARAAVLGALLTEEDVAGARPASPLLAQLCRWEVHDGDPPGCYLLEQVRTLIRKRFGDTPPKVLDSFGGGGSIPLEALRLGCGAQAVEYNSSVGGARRFPCPSFGSACGMRRWRGRSNGPWRRALFSSCP